MSTNFCVAELPHLKRIPTKPHQDSFVILVGTAGPRALRTIGPSIVFSGSVVLGHYALGCASQLIVLLHMARTDIVDYPTHALTNPMVQVTIATRLTTICGVFFTRSVHVRNATVPTVNAAMFQGYAAGPTALRTCPAMIAAAPIHWMMSFVLFMMLV